MDQLFSTKKSNINSVSSNLNVSAFENPKQVVQNDQQSEKQDGLSKGELHDRELIENNAVMGDACCHQDSTSDSAYNMQDMQDMQDMHMAQNNSCRSIETQSNEEEPLDCTADIGHAETPKHEPLDYTLDMDSETGYKTYLPNEPVYKPEENLQRKGINTMPFICVKIKKNYVISRPITTKTSFGGKKYSACRASVYFKMRRLKLTERLYRYWQLYRHVKDLTHSTAIIDGCAQY